MRFRAPRIFHTFLASTHYICLFCVFFFPLFSFCMFVCPLSPSHSDLDCPVVWGSSGLLLFSCSLRYLSRFFPPWAFQLVLGFHSPWPQSPWLQIWNKTCFCRCTQSLPHTPRYAFRDNIITVYIHIGTPTVDPCAQSTMGEAQESIRSQLLCNWVIY